MSDWLEIFNTYRAPTQHLVSVMLAAACWRWGGSPERWLSGIFLAAMVLPVYLFRAFGVTKGLEIGPYASLVMLIDLFAAAMFVGVALQANRSYPLWIAGFQLVALGAHLVRGMVDSVSPLAVAVLVIGPSYFQLLLILCGFVRHLQRQRRFGPYREWRIAAPRGGMLKA